MLESDATILKQCTKCGKVLPATTEYFVHDKRKRSGLQARCKECDRAYRIANRERSSKYFRQYREENRERLAAYYREWRSLNREYRLEYDRKYHVEHPTSRRNLDPVSLEQQRAYDREYYRKNIDRKKKRDRMRRERDPEAYHSYYRAWRASNREIILERKREYHEKYREKENNRSRKNRKLNRDQRQEYARRNILRSRVHTQNHRARKRDLRSDFTPEQQKFALDYFNNSCAICGRQLFDLFGDHGLAFDHWIPLSNSECPGTTATNMIPMCHGVDGCNNSKQASLPEEWLVRRFGKRKAKVILARVREYFEIVRIRQNDAGA